MKNILILAAVALSLGGCLGRTSADNEATGQVKRLQHKTPLFCPDYTHVDISLGVMRNGVGSMSTQDLWLYVPNDGDRALLEKAAETGALVKITYDVARARWFDCVEKETVTHVAVVQ